MTDLQSDGLAIFVVVAYFFPALIAILRRHHNRMAIVVLDVLLGWTAIGWVVAFIWSLTAVRQPD